MWLEDGTRKVKADNKQCTMSLDMEAPFESLQVFAVEIAKRFDSLQAFVIKEMTTQSNLPITATAEGQTCIKCRIAHETQEHRNNQEFQEWAESITKTDDVRRASPLN